jgi:acetylornithine deacetylase/succinyl-diaminopimelate desuccinylase-like protein
MRRLAICFALVAFALAADTRVNPLTYLEHVKFLASDDLRGRATGTPEAQRSAKYIAAQFKKMGLKPVAGSYYQYFTVTTQSRIAPSTRFSYSIGGVSHDLKLKDTFQVVGPSASGAFSGPVVFAGYGITAPEYQYDDYAGIDVKDKVVLIFRSEPQQNDDKSKFAGRNDTSHAQLVNKGINAKMHGAKAVVLVNPMFARTDDPLDTFSQSAGQAGIPFVQIKADLAESFFQAAGKTSREIGEAIDKDLQPRSFALPDTVRVDSDIEVQHEHRQTANVTGYKPGTTDEYIVIGAHYDHLGLGDNHSLGKIGEIHHGADDNASGTAGVLELARWFAKQPKQKRGILFLTFTGEELGLLGSAYYVGHPELPLEKAAAMINMDMIGRIREGKVYLAGSGTGANFKDLIGQLKGKYDFQLDLSETAGYGSSDHTSFTTKQVPVLFFFSGLHGDYHKPSDTWDKIDAPHAAKLLDLVADLATRLVSDPDRPQYVRVEPPAMPRGASGGSSGYGPYFGSIPDFAELPKGVRFADIRAGSPAEKAGLKPGDILVEFDSKTIANLYDYTYALRTKKPGDEVRVKVVRSGETIEAKVLLTERK